MNKYFRFGIVGLVGLFLLLLLWQPLSFILSISSPSSSRHIIVLHERIDSGQTLPTADLSFLSQSKYPLVVVHPDIIPVLAVFFRTGWSFLERYINSIDFPVEQLVIIQDGEEEDISAHLDEYRRGRGASFLSIRHIVNVHHTGCSGAWNTLYRLYPHHPFWLFAAFDVTYPPGELRKFYGLLLEHSKDPRVGMISAKVNFYYEDKKIRETFGFVQWAVTRSGLMNVGLYDENIFPAYYEDDDYIYRNFLAGMKVFAVDAIVNHGLPTDKGYIGGTTRVASNDFNSQLAKGGSIKYYKLKWGQDMASVIYALFNKENALQEWKAQHCRFDKSPSTSGIFCRPYDSQAFDYKTWTFSTRFRSCLTSVGTDCITQFSLTESTPQGALVVDNWNDQKETALFEDSYNFAMKRLKRVFYQIKKDPNYNALVGWGTRNQGMMWDLYEPFWNCHNKERLGRIGDGGKWVCNVDRLAKQSTCVVYSFGSNGEISFEEDLIERTRGLCEVHIFDPTLTDETKGNNNWFNGPEANDLRKGKELPHIHWYAEGLGDAHRVVKFDRGGNITVRSLTYFMAQLGHKNLDILKIDIEGMEIPTFMNSIFKLPRLPFRQLLIEFHVGDPPPIMLWFEQAERMGLRMYSKDIMQYGACNPLCRNVEISFENVLFDKV